MISYLPSFLLHISENQEEMSQDELLSHQQSFGQLSQASSVASVPRRPLSLDVSTTAPNSPKPPLRSATAGSRATTLRRAALMLRASQSTASLQNSAWPMPSRSQSALVLQPATSTTLMPPPTSPCCCCGHPDPTALGALTPRQYGRSSVNIIQVSILYQRISTHRKKIKNIKVQCYFMFLIRSRSTIQQFIFANNILKLLGIIFSLFCLETASITRLIVSLIL
jgi:hypothetical protein